MKNINLFYGASLTPFFIVRKRTIAIGVGKREQAAAKANA
jgi:hypothetical protein